MTEPAPPAKDASAEEIEADIAATRERLAESVDALADKVNVKARAEEKVEYTKEQVRDVLGQAKAKGENALGQAKATGENALGQAKRAPLAVQIAAVAVPVLALLLVIVNKIRRRRS